jgi:hypothetical protein
MIEPRAFQRGSRFQSRYMIVTNAQIHLHSAKCGITPARIDNHIGIKSLCEKRRFVREVAATCYIVSNQSEPFDNH